MLEAKMITSHAIRQKAVDTAVCLDVLLAEGGVLTPSKETIDCVVASGFAWLARPWPLVNDPFFEFERNPKHTRVDGEESDGIGKIKNLLERGVFLTAARMRIHKDARTRSACMVPVSAPWPLVLVPSW